MNFIPKCLIFVVVLASCQGSKPKKWSDLPDAKELADYKQTVFVPTLEHPLVENKNIIYAPAFLFAWGEVKQALKTPVEAGDSNSVDFKLLTQSYSHIKALTKPEYTADVKVKNREIDVKAFFNVTLPFVNKLQQNDPIAFGKKKVMAFGMGIFDEGALKSCQILYYKDDDHFMLKLLPKNEQHEVLLVKGLYNKQTLSNAVNAAYAYRRLGEKEYKDWNQYWKYEITEEDIISIPAIQFNIETHYPQLEKQRFPANGIIYEVVTAWQRTGFILNEKGAVVESEAMVYLDSAAAILEEPEKRHPKKLIFDKPFYIIIKKADATNPYFVMKVDNTELMIVP